MIWAPKDVSPLKYKHPEVQATIPGTLDEEKNGYVARYQLLYALYYSEVLDTTGIPDLASL